MNYRVTCLTPTLVGDGTSLSPIDYMVWKDQVNVLDQRRIFKLLARGPRLDGYLTQIRRAEKLDFASWGGFAQNFAGRRIPFDHPAAAQHWGTLRNDQLFIPTFAVDVRGRAYLPGSALKGALRTALLAKRLEGRGVQPLVEREDGLPRRAGETLERLVLGGSGSDAMRSVAVADSGAVAAGTTKVYQVRVSTIESRGPGQLAPGWKQNLRPGAVQFAEMAVPGTVFEGPFRGKSAGSVAKLLDAANSYAALTLEAHRRYALALRLTTLADGLAALIAQLEQVRARSGAAMAAIGWGSGLLGKSGWPHLDDPQYRKLLGELPNFSRAVRSGLPFPKTRRVVMMANQPAALPGWVLVEVG